jgi:hypothetical protein
MSKVAADLPAENQPGTALVSAMTTEHFVMQTVIGATAAESMSRATIYIMALSSSLLALGFAANTQGFGTFIACLIPAIFVLGIFTVLRMVDIAMESMEAYIAIARIRAFYRSLGPEAERHFAAEHGRWPEGKYVPGLRIGRFAGYVTSAAMMIATVNAMVAGAGITFLAQWLGAALFVALVWGAAAGLAFLVVFFLYQRWRIDELAKAASRADN